MTDPAPKTRRSRGEGSVTWHRKSRTWQARVSCGKDAAGKRIVKVAYAPTKKEASAKLHDLRQRFLTGAPEPTLESLSAYLERWLNHIETRVRKTTFASYAQTVQAYVLKDPLALAPLGKITPLMVEEMLGRLRKAGLGAATRKMTFVVLKMSLKKAVAWELLVTSPMSDGKVDAPRYAAAKRKVWTHEEALKFLAAAKDDRLYALYVLALTCGLRHGELLGLRWKNVDLDGKLLHVTEALPEVNGYVQPLEEPKTRAGVRTLPLSELAIAALKSRREVALGEGTAASEFVFPNLEGKPASKRMVYRSYAEVLSKAGVPQITLHDLRHTSASLMRAAGLDMKLLSTNLGHAQLAITANKYAHVYPSEQVEVRAVMSGLWG